MQKNVLSIWRIFLTKIAPGDLDIAVIGQLPAAQLALDDWLEPRPLEMEAPTLTFAQSPTCLCIPYRYFAGRIIARHIWATGLLSKPRPCSG